MPGTRALSCPVAARLLRLAVVVSVASAIVYVASLFGPGMAVLAAAVCALVLCAAWWWLPRAAHKRFGRGDYARAAIYYQVLRRCRFEAAARASVEVSLAACALAREDWPRALQILDSIEPAVLGDSARAAWLNNRGYALARSGEDLAAALECSEEAISLRPDVAGFRHTRGVALLGLGRADEAIHELDSLWKDHAGGEIKPLLEAERCYDLGLAWRSKGELDYAKDYFERARRAAPESRWAELAREHLDGPRPNPALADFIEA